MSGDLIDTTEMYLRTVLELEEEGIVPMRARIVERLQHSGPTVSQTVSRMERDDLLEVQEDRSLALTELGRSRAVEVMRKHRLAERLLSDVVGLDIAYVHEEACRWEHVMSERVERRLMDLLGGPQYSPYGTPIPGTEALGGTVASEDSFSGLTVEDALERDSDTVYTVRLLPEVVQADQHLLETLSKVGVARGAQVRVAEAEGDRVSLTVLETNESVEIDLSAAKAIRVDSVGGQV